MATIPVLRILETREAAERERDRRVAMDVEVEPLVGGRVCVVPRGELRIEVGG